jgi:nitrite reductase/ring-hydroxylating ferredoxin subunit
MADAAFYPTPIDPRSLDQDAPNLKQVGTPDAPIEVMVVKDGDKYRIVRDLCPHMGAPLSQGRLCHDRTRLACPWHGYEFELATGEFMHNPNDERYACMKHLYQSFKPEKTPRYRLRLLGYEVRDGAIYVRRGGAK